MAMNLGYNTKQLIIGTVNAVAMENSTYDALIGSDGKPVGQVSRTGAALSTIRETEYIDLGIVTGESEDLTAGGIAVSVPTLSADKRYNWAVGGRVVRVTISGIIPDGIYVADTTNALDTDATIVNGKSNSSVFRYKAAKWLAYSSLFGENSSKIPNTVQYRRYGIDEKNATGAWSISNSSEIGSWVCTNYITSYIEGTRHLQYTITLDFANDFGDLEPNSNANGIKPRVVGDL